MTTPRVSRALVAALVLLPAAAPSTTAARPAWTGSRVIGSPDPPPAYRMELAFPRLTFERPTELVGAPGTNRLFVAELRGKISSFPNRADVQAADPFCDLRRDRADFGSLYSLVFPPTFPRARVVYVMYTLRGKRPHGSRVSRLQVTGDHPPRCDPASEEVLIEWQAGGHNGGSLQFANDGTLFISTGDGAEPFPPDGFDVGQSLDDLMAAILRIDVTGASAGRRYLIPDDNPFVNTPGARGEIWAYGLRNPWKISVDAATGEVWAGDVGWETWEMIHRIERGGNYGWSLVEGPLAVRPDARPGPSPILPPVMAHPHTEARSITGGHVYRGRQLPALRGAYVYGDFETGRVWGLRYDPAARKVTWHEELARTNLNLVAFGRDPAGELLALDYGGGTVTRSFRPGQVYRLAAGTRVATNRRFPTRLGGTGLFRSTAAHALAPGVVRYQVNAEPWMDGASGERFIALPGRTRVDVTASGFRFPPDAVLGKTLLVSGRRVETQLLHLDGQEWRGYSYRWDEAGKDATLVERGGADARIGSVSWRFVGRNECTACHNTAAGPVLGFAPSQLDRPAPGGGQVQALVRTGVLAAMPPEPHPRLSNPYDPGGPLGVRARSWLHVNCAQCHRVGGGTAAIQLPFETELSRTELVGARPMQGTFSIDGAAVIAPGDPFRSTLFYRLITAGGGRMPRVGARTMDMRGVALIEAWIRGLSRPPDAPAPLTAREAIARPPEQALASTAQALALARAIDHGLLSPAERDQAVAQGTAHPGVQVRGLYERFVPEEQRVPRLGDRIDPARLLSLPADATRGRALFFEGGVACATCHRVDGNGGAFGPDLTQVGARLPREKILESLLDPSKEIDQRYRSYLLETREGEALAGIVTERAGDHVALIDAQGVVHRIGTARVRQLVPQEKSAMPEALLAALTAQQAADLLAFLASLR